MNLDRLFDKEHRKRDFLWKGGFFTNGISIKKKN